MLYDVIIVGGGPAGLTASIYSIRAGKKVLLIEKMVIGGQVAYTTVVENYPGIKKITGGELAELMLDHAKSLGVEIVYSEVLDIQAKDKIKKVRTHEGTFEGKTIILCLGASAKQLNLPNEKKLLGRGISYCATCDGNLFKGKRVAIVGGGNSSLEDSIHLSGLASEVYIIHRKDVFRGENILVNQVETLASKNNNFKILYNTAIEEIVGEDKLESLKLVNLITKERTTLDVDALFIAIGRKPDTEMFAGEIELDKNGYIITNERMETSIPGVYAAGDVRKKQLRQIVTAESDGAIASININDYIFKNCGS